eukprot:gene2639-biopygen20059
MFSALVARRGTVADGEHNLHAAAVALVGDEGVVEPAAPVDNVVQQAAAPLGEVVEGQGLVESVIIRAR